MREHFNELAARGEGVAGGVREFSGVFASCEERHLADSSSDPRHLFAWVKGGPRASRYSLTDC